MTDPSAPFTLTGVVTQGVECLVFVAGDRTYEPHGLPAEYARIGLHLQLRVVSEPTMSICMQGDGVRVLEVRPAP